jgi:hypothetical protein
MARRRLRRFLLDLAEREAKAKEAGGQPANTKQCFDFAPSKLQCEATDDWPLVRLYKLHISLNYAVKGRKGNGRKCGRGYVAGARDLSE